MEFASRAQTALRCANIGAIEDKSMQYTIIQEKLRAVQFLRAVSQCTEMALDVCLVYMQKDSSSSDGEAGNNNVTAFLDTIRTAAWMIFASLEPKLFWDWDPFWTGTDPQITVHSIAWKLYVRLYMLVAFDRVQALQRIKSRIYHVRGNDKDDTGYGDEEEEQHADYHPHYTRRSIYTPRQLGIRARTGMSVSSDAASMESAVVVPYMVEADMESWPMSVLFFAIDTISEAWQRMMYNTANVRFVARCLLRYATLSYARTPKRVATESEQSGCRYAHDDTQYCCPSADGEWIAVDPDTYYGIGGSVLRDVLGDLCVVSHADCWVSSLTSPEEDGDAGSSLRLAPLAERLLSALDTYIKTSTADDDDDSIVERCIANDNVNIIVADFHRMESMKARARRCFAAFRQFLRSQEAAASERTLVESGVFPIIQPGEVWKFARCWPDHGATPITVVNAMRSRDMKQYEDNVMSGDLGSMFDVVDVGGGMEVGKMPRCLEPVVDHMGWETARQMLRMLAVHESTESMTTFLVEPYQIRASTVLPRAGSSIMENGGAWERFRVWIDAGTDGDQLFRDPIDELVSRITTFVEYPPFPAVLILRGRVLLWNPYAPHIDHCRHQQEESSDDEWIVECLRSAVVDASDDSMAMTLYLWLLGRIALVNAVVGDPAYRDRIPVEVKAMGDARLVMYRTLMRKWFAGKDD